MMDFFSKLFFKHITRTINEIFLWNFKEKKTLACARFSVRKIWYQSLPNVVVVCSVYSVHSINSPHHTAESFVRIHSILRMCSFMAAIIFQTRPSYTLMPTTSLVRRQRMTMFCLILSFCWTERGIKMKIKRRTMRQNAEKTDIHASRTHRHAAYTFSHHARTARYKHIIKPDRNEVKRMKKQRKEDKTETWCENFERTELFFFRQRGRLGFFVCTLVCVCVLYLFEQFWKTVYFVSPH